MVEYCVVFAGEILPGFDKAAVRRAASDALRASTAQLDQLFSGKPVIMKRGLTLAQGKHYLAVLGKTGMRASLSPPPPEMPASTYRIVFRGELLSGFDAVQVNRLAANALRFSGEQLQQLFSGKRAILKRGLDREKAEHFRAQLARIGMQAALEQELPAAVAASVAPLAAPAPADVMAQHMETLVVGGDMLARHLADMQAPSAAPQRMPASEMATMVVADEALTRQMEAHRSAASARESMPSIEAAVQRAASSEASLNSRFVRCPACGSKQPMRQLCVACGKTLTPAEAPATVMVMAAPQDVSLPPEPTGTLDDPEVAAPMARRRAAWLLGGLLFVLCMAIAGFVWLY